MPANDAINFEDLKLKCDSLAEMYTERNTMYDDIEKIYLLDWKAPATQRTDLKLTISPSGRNAALGAIRLLTATEPTWAVPYDKSSDAARKVSDNLERFASAIWYSSGRIRQRPVHFDAVHSAVLFGEVHIGMILTKAMLDSFEDSDSPESESARIRLERAVAQTPISFEVYDPRTGFPEYDSAGLSSYYRKIKVRASEVLDRWGQTALDIGLDPEKRTEEVTLNEYWDYVWHVVWVEGKDLPLLNERHGLKIIPIVCYVTDGSSIHGDVTKQRQPFLYTLLKTNLWERQNLMLTYGFDNIAKMGLTPSLFYKKADEEDEFYIDDSLDAGVMTGRGDYRKIDRDIIDDAVLQMQNKTEEIVTESTLFKQALGQPVGANTPFSAVALLNQSGRLPLVTIQKLCSEAFGKAMETAFFLLKSNSAKRKMTARNSENGIFEIDRTEIPSDCFIVCTVEISTPQDGRQDVMIAMQAAQSGMTTKQFARETYMGIGQSRDMDKQIFDEQVSDFMLKMQMQKMQFQEQMKQQQEMMKLQQQGKIPPSGGATQPNTPPGQPGVPGMSGQPAMTPNQAPTSTPAPDQMAALLGGMPGGAESMMVGNGLPGTPLDAPYGSDKMPSREQMGGM